MAGCTVTSGDQELKKFRQALIGWMLDCVYFWSFEEYMEGMKISDEKIWHLLVQQEILGKNDNTKPNRPQQKKLMRLLALLSKSQNDFLQRSGKTALEDAVVIFQQLVDGFSDKDTAFMIMAREIEVEMKAQAVYMCCNAGDFLLAHQVFQRLDLLNALSLCTKTKATVRDVMTVLQRRKMDHPILLNNSYDEFVNKMHAFLHYIHKTIPEPFLIEVYRQQLNNTLSTSKVQAKADSQLSSLSSSPTHLPFGDVLPYPCPAIFNCSATDSDKELWESLEDFENNANQMVSHVSELAKTNVEAMQIPDKPHDVAFHSNRNNFEMQQMKDTLLDYHTLDRYSSELVPCQVLCTPMELDSTYLLSQRRGTNLMRSGTSKESGVEATTSHSMKIMESSEPSSHSPSLTSQSSSCIPILKVPKKEKLCLKREQHREGRGRKGKAWTINEEDKLYAGIRKYGPRKWQIIKENCNLPDRTNIDLSDKWRNLKRNPMHLKAVKERWGLNRRLECGSPPH